MTMKIAPGLSLDPDYVGGGTFALLAKKGAGKSYLARVMAEEFWRAKVPFALIDPMGAAWGLRAAADGEGAGIPVTIFGGDHADAPLERTGGALMADLLIDERLSMILDLSGLGTRAAERQFAHDFLERLYRRNSELVHLMIDEADLFAPQRPAPGDQPLLGVTENIVRRGRNRGIGVTLITQRPAVLNKDVLTQVDGLVAMRVTGYQDREAIDDWVRGHGDQEAAGEVKGTLSGLGNGECWWWIPELDVLQRVQVRKSRTFDSSPTRTRGAARPDPKGFADVDLEALSTRMAATIERAAESDPKELRRRLAAAEARAAAAEAERDNARLDVEDLGQRVRELDQQLDQRPAIDVPVIETVDLDRIEGALELVRGELAELRAQASRMVDVASTEASTNVSTPAPPQTPVPERRPAIPPPRSVRPDVRPAGSGDAVDGITLRSGERALLEALAGYPEPLTRARWGALAAVYGGRSYKPSGGTFGTYVSVLKRHGLVAVDGSSPATITTEGLAFLDETGRRPAVLRYGRGLREVWMGLLRSGERRMLEVLIETLPGGMTRAELGEASGFTASGGTFGTYLSVLRRYELVEVSGDQIKAEPWLSG